VIDWKRFSLKIGRVRIRLKTFVISAIMTGLGFVAMLDVYTIQPIVSMFVNDDKREAFIMAVLGVLFMVLRGITTGPLWEIDPPAPEADDEEVKP
jgi:hypothetical protein